MHQPILWQYILPLKEDNLSIYNGQNDPSQCVRYLEVPLYIKSLLDLHM